MIEIKQVAIDSIPGLWQRIHGMLKDPIDRSNGAVTEASVLRKLLCNETKLFVAERDTVIILAFTLEPITYESGKRVLSIPLIGGEALIANDDSFMKQLDQIIIKAGFEELIGMSVRPAWNKVLKKYNWKTVHEVINYKVGDVYVR